MRNNVTDNDRDKTLDRGFTLMELVVVLALIGIITGLIAPGLVNSFYRARLKTSAQKTVAIINYTRNQAVFTKKPYWLIVDRKTNRVTVMDVTTAGTVKQGWSRASEALPLSTKIYYYPEEVTIEKLVIGGKEISDSQGVFTFFPNGSSSGGEIGLNAKKKMTRSYFIAIDPLISTAKVLTHEEETT